MNHIFVKKNNSMDSMYLVLVAVLFALAISDLIVGVSNDAVNFLNSAIGSKAASIKVVMALAALGVLVGAVFSSGMMEIARKGIFHPEMFSFSEIIIIFIAVMVTDVILLDTFNTFGLPTSTTVSIVFELLGAAVAVSIVKISGNADQTMAELGTYINTSKALAIISGILLSVVIAFSVGAIIQYFARLLFSFQYKKNLKFFGALFGGLSLTVITYFMLIKGTKGASFMDVATKDYITENALFLLSISFVGWTFILQMLYWLFKVNPLKIVVLAGTFSLAMAFAGNDLVNFIGVPLGGLQAYELFSAVPGADPDTFMMTGLTGKAQSPTWILLLAGVVMMITLYTSSKAKAVVKTSVDLSRQGEGSERFESSFMSRMVVRSAKNLNDSISKVLPQSVRNSIDNRFQAPDEPEEGVPVAFDLIRASSNLVVASILIAIGTSLKLPLSTTYVTFMVAMGTSLADRAWGRDSAVYRITGVLSIIGGWFFTAFAAFTLAFLMALLFTFGGFVAIIIMVILAGYMLFRTYKMFRKKNAKNAENQLDDQVNDITGYKAQTTRIISGYLENIFKTLDDALSNFYTEKSIKLQKIKREVEKIDNDCKTLREHSNDSNAIVDDEQYEVIHFQSSITDYLRNASHDLNFIVNPLVKHVNNSHKPFNEVQILELREVMEMVNEFEGLILEIINTGDYKKIDLLNEKIEIIFKVLKVRAKNQLRRVKSDSASTRTSWLYLNTLNELKSLMINVLNVAKSHRDFLYNGKPEE